MRRFLSGVDLSAVTQKCGFLSAFSTRGLVRPVNALAVGALRSIAGEALPQSEEAKKLRAFAFANRETAQQNRALAGRLRCEVESLRSKAKFEADADKLKIEANLWRRIAEVYMCPIGLRDHDYQFPMSKFD